MCSRGLLLVFMVFQEQRAMFLSLSSFLALLFCKSLSSSLVPMSLALFLFLNKKSLIKSLVYGCIIRKRYRRLSVVWFVTVVNIHCCCQTWEDSLLLTTFYFSTTASYICRSLSVSGCLLFFCLIAFSQRFCLSFLRRYCNTAVAHLSHRNSVCLSVTHVNQSKTVQARITKFLLTAAWKTLVSWSIKLFHKFERGDPSRGR